MLTRLAVVVATVWALQSQAALAQDEGGAGSPRSVEGRVAERRREILEIFASEGPSAPGATTFGAAALRRPADPSPGGGSLKACTAATRQAIALLARVALHSIVQDHPRAMSPADAEPAAVRLAIMLRSGAQVQTIAAAALPACSADAHRRTFKLTGSDGSCTRRPGSAVSYCACNGPAGAYAQIVPPNANAPDWANPACWSWNSPDAKAGLTALAILANRNRSTWSAETKQAILDLIAEPGWSAYVANDLRSGVGNQQLQLPVANALIGEATCDAGRWSAAREAVRALLQTTWETGGREPIAPRYGRYHFAQLAALGLVADPGMRAAADALWAYTTLLYGSWVLPGGVISNPQARNDTRFDSVKGMAGLTESSHREKTTGPILWALGGDPAWQPPADLAKVEPPAALALAASAFGTTSLAGRDGDLFRQKPDEYTVRALHHLLPGEERRSPGAVYGRGQGLASAAAVLELHVLPGGVASLGGYLGTSLFPQIVSNGATVSCPRCEQRGAKVYQYQPFVCRKDRRTICDVREDGAAIQGLDPDPDDFEGEGYDREQYLYHRTLVQLFDPLDRVSRADGKMRLDRLHEYTMLAIPRWDDPQIGGRRAGEDWGKTSDGWRAGQVGDVYVGVRPLGRVAATTPIRVPLYRSSGDGYALESIRLDGRSGSIVEIATAADYPSLGAFLASLQERFVRFEPAGSNGQAVAEFDAMGPDRSLHRMKLEYRPHSEAPPDFSLEGRSLDGVPQEIGGFVRPGPLWGDLIRWDDAQKTMTFQGRTWDFDAIADSIPPMSSICRQPASSSAPRS